MHCFMEPPAPHAKHISLRAGFEPAREDPIGFQVQRLNHSAITAWNLGQIYLRGILRTYGTKSILID